MNILDTIIGAKKREVDELKKNIPLSDWEESIFFERPVLSLKASLLAGKNTGIITEFKRRSPSKGIINDHSAVEEVTEAYTLHGASGLSILTDHDFFGGSSKDLENARFNKIPILRKDFIIDEYQIVQAKGIGADLILLIAACLTPGDVKRLAAFASSLDLEVLLEIHSENELAHICDETSLIGVNNRNLQTFEVDLERSLKMAEKIPPEKVRIAESGIDSVSTIRLFRENGFKGFLIGENFMKSKNPAKAFAEFANELAQEGDFEKRSFKKSEG